jgi:hypothetical protein
MCPQLQLHHEVELERGKRALESGAPGDVLAMAMKLWRLTIHQDQIIRAATRHIAALEAQAALSGSGPL